MTLVLVCSAIAFALLLAAAHWADAGPALDELDRAIDRIGRGDA